MMVGKRTWLLVAGTLLVAGMAGCGNFWQKPGSGSTSFSLSNSGTMVVNPGATSGNTAVITVSPSSSFTGTVALSCSVAAPSGASNPTTCSLSPTSVSISNSSAQTSTLTATTQSGTTLGNYTATVTGSSGSVAETTSVCVVVTTSSSGSCSGTSSGTSGVFYVLNQQTGQVVAMSFTSGQFTTIGALNLPSVHPTAIAVAPNGKFLYVGTTGGIYLYTIGSGGALNLGNGGSKISADVAQTMQVDSTNSWLVDAVSGLSQLSAIAINSNTGVLASPTESEQLLSGGLPATTPVQLAISPGDSSSCNDCYVFVAMGDGGIEAIGFNPGNANPFGITRHTGVLHSGGDNSVAVDPSNRLLYVGEADALPSNNQSGGLRVFTISATGVAEISGSPYSSGGTGPTAIVPTSDGNYVYVGNQSSSSNDTIASFSVSAASLSSVTTATAGNKGPLSMAEDSTGSYLLATYFGGNPDLQAYTMSSGTLASTRTGATGNDPVQAVAIAAAP